MNRTKILVCLLLGIMFVASGAVRADEVLTSPDGRYRFTFAQRNGRLRYDLDYAGRRIVQDGELGVDVDNHLAEAAMGIPRDTSEVWTEGMWLTRVERTERDTLWHTLYGENSQVRDRYREMTLHLAKGGQEGDMANGYDKRRTYRMDIRVRAYDEGVALCYHFPEATNGLFLHITGERTSFPLPPGTLAWHETWAQGPYQRMPLRDWPDECERPLLLELPDGLAVALLEAGLVDYPRGKFRLAGDDTLQVALYGMADIVTPYTTPWRVVMAAERPVDLINHKDIVLNLNAPCRDVDMDFVRPGKAFRSSRLDRESIRRSIDFCARFGLQYVELDAGWYGPEMKVESDATRVAANRDFDMADICQYARSRGVGVWLYVNQRALTRQLDDLLPLYRRWGVAGLKFGFVQVGSQQATEWLHRAVRRCAEHGLMVDIHDEYRPTGVSRTLPNLLTQEGIRGNEEMPDATHNVVLPFTRLLCGAADYTLCYFNNRVKNTHAHQLAMAAVYYSPLQFMFWYDLPDAYRGEEELQFWRDIPTTFDQSIALDGQPGQYIVQARRSGADWYVGAMTNTEARRIVLDTDFLLRGKYVVDIYEDAPALQTRTKVARRTLKLKPGRPIVLDLQPSGGAALHFRPADSK